MGADMLSWVTFSAVTCACVLSIVQSSVFAPVGVGADVEVLSGVVIPAEGGSSAVHSVVLSVFLSFVGGMFSAGPTVVGAEVLSSVVIWAVVVPRFLGLVTARAGVLLIEPLSVFVAVVARTQVEVLSSVALRAVGALVRRVEPSLTATRLPLLLLWLIGLVSTFPAFVGGRRLSRFAVLVDAEAGLSLITALAVVVGWVAFLPAVRANVLSVKQFPVFTSAAIGAAPGVSS
ncbi:MAG: hypothetical protein KVP17_002046 [Porospora cf. gigantea B]|uniref:uncharacterized protein n=1 Tax=Porospora cf. gigantea B TaxID=2853592 RepID=UPI003571E17D|nr:MAG: hypothetical protein KVP17_002046 [Porospora cf. gigantea B]